MNERDDSVKEEASSNFKEESSVALESLHQQGGPERSHSVKEVQRPSEHGKENHNPDKVRQDSSDEDTEFVFKPEDVIDNKYKVICQIGVGGMGRVYKVLQMNIKQTRALKVIKGSLFQKEDSGKVLENFRREAEISASIQNQHSVIVHDLTEDKERNLFYIVMEYVEGVSLRDILKDTGKLTEEEAFVVICEILDVLMAANRKKIVHCDIKPENIMIPHDGGDVKLLDLGIAKKRTLDEQSEARYKMVSGTPGYVSPEQILKPEMIDCRADIYSLGVTLYELVTGQLPYSGKKRTELVENQINKPFPDPRAVEPSLSSGMVDLILKMTKKHPKDRFKSPDKVLDFINEKCKVPNKDAWAAIKLLLYHRAEGVVNKNVVTPIHTGGTWRGQIPASGIWGKILKWAVCILLVCLGGWWLVQRLVPTSVMIQAYPNATIRVVNEKTGEEFRKSEPTGVILLNLPPGRYSVLDDNQDMDGVGAFLEVSPGDDELIHCMVYRLKVVTEPDADVQVEQVDSLAWQNAVRSMNGVGMLGSAMSHGNGSDWLMNGFPVASGKSNRENGVFVAEIPAGKYRVTVSKPGLISESREISFPADAEIKKGIAMVMRRPLAISAPNGAMVTVKALDGTVLAEEVSKGKSIKVALPSGEYQVSVSLDGYEPACQVVDIVETPSLEVKLSLKTYPLVVDAMAESTVYVRDENDVLLVTEGRCKQDGTSELRIPAGEYWVQAVSANREKSQRKKVSIPSDTKISLEYVRCHVVVYSSPGAHILILGSSEYGSSEYWEGVCDSKGEYSLKIQPGRYQVRVALDGYDSMEQAVDIRKEEESVGMRLVPRKVLAVVVAVAGAEVVARDFQEQVVARGVCNEKGRCVLSVPAGQYKVSCSLYGYCPLNDQEFLVQKDKDELRLMMSPLEYKLQITGIARAEVLVVGDNQREYHGVCDREGSCRIGVPKGGYDVVVTPPEGGLQWTKKVTVSGQENLECLSFPRNRHCLMLNCHVGNAFVQVRTENGDEVASGRTGPDGEFQATVYEGTYQAVVSASDYLSKMSKITLEEDYSLDFRMQEALNTPKKMKQIWSAVEKGMEQASSQSRRSGGWLTSSQISALVGRAEESLKHLGELEPTEENAGQMRADTSAIQQVANALALLSDGRIALMKPYQLQQQRNASDVLRYLDDLPKALKEYDSPQVLALMVPAVRGNLLKLKEYILEAKDGRVGKNARLALDDSLEAIEKVLAILEEKQRRE